MNRNIGFLSLTANKKEKMSEENKMSSYQLNEIAWETIGIWILGTIITVIIVWALLYHLRYVKKKKNK